MTYNNLFLNDYRTPSEINPFDTSLLIELIPRGVIDNHDLRIIPPLIVIKEKSHKQAAKCKEIPESVIA